MGDIQNRPFSKNYSGLINQSVIAIGITILCVGGQEIMKRRRRGKNQEQEGLGSRESWEFGYLYQGRSWARFPSPPVPIGWPLAWIKQVVWFPEAKMNELRGVDAALYIRFLRGTFWFTLLHALTTFPILFPIHVKFSSPEIPAKSMTRASISSLVGTDTGLSLLWIHICLLFWITLSWMGTLLWICTGAFRLRAANIDATSKLVSQPVDVNSSDKVFHPHPHPGYTFHEVPSFSGDLATKGLRQRTIMVSNVPASLRNEKELKEYFEYYMSRKVEKPSMGLTSSTQPGFLNKSVAFVLNRAKRLPVHLPVNPLISRESASQDRKEEGGKTRKRNNDLDVPNIERVVIARKMTELASLLERREEILRLLETAHVKLANKTLLAVKTAVDRKGANKSVTHGVSRAAEVMKKRRSAVPDAERGEPQEGTLDEEQRMNQLIEVLGPYVEEFGCQRTLRSRSKKAVSRTSRQAFRKLRLQGSEDGCELEEAPVPPSMADPCEPLQKTVWEALLSLPRSSLDAYQPLVNLSHLFRGKTVPAIDYYTAKLNLLTSLITENRAKAVNDYDPVSTAFVTFEDPADARRACKYLAVHPNNPLACLVTMAPQYQDLDWIRVMKPSPHVEFVKDWVVNIGVWAFTLFWLFPVSLLVGLVSIQNISLFWPSLKTYLDRHAWESEVIQSFLPTILVALLALLIPLILLLIAKKAHTITTLSALHDLIMTRYYKFLIVNVLVFFCVGTAALQSLLQSFKSSAQSRPDVLKIVADSFPTAGPFYVGWLIFTTAMHGGFELALLGLPLILYPSTSRQVTPRKRTIGTRPRTLNYYYWLPNHMLVIHVLLLFCVLNPFVLPFGALYFFVQSGVIKNQLIHVYAKNYEGNGKHLLIRMVRYSLDGLVLSQAVFLTYMVVLKKSANVGLSAFLIVFTVTIKLLMTRMCRAQFELDDIIEAEILCEIYHGRSADSEQGADVSIDIVHAQNQDENGPVEPPSTRWSISTLRLPAWVNFSYATMRHRARVPQRRPNPFGPNDQSFSRLPSVSRDSRHVQKITNVPPEGPEIFPVEESSSEGPVEEYPWNWKEHVASSEPRADAGMQNTHPMSDETTGPVVAHPPPVPWDDLQTPDLPYDNPYYTRTIDNVLWLPRDPTGILDLDDTVDLKISLTVEPAQGKLGTWLGVQETASPDELLHTASHASLRSEKPPVAATPPIRQHSLLDIDGTEDIELPPVIARRVQSREDGVEQTVRPRRPSTYRSKISLTDKSSIGAASSQVRRRPSVLDGPSPTIRSFSDKTPGRGRSSSIMSALHPIPHKQRSRSNDQRPPPPDTHAQAEFVAANTSASRLSVVPPRPSRAQNVSTRDAIAHEVLEEEREALINRLAEEQEEEEKARTTKSWLTSWMFRKPW